MSAEAPLGRPGSAGAYVAREDEPYPPVAGKGSPSVAASRNMGNASSSSAGGRPAHMPDEHQPPQTFAPDDDVSSQAGGGAYSDDSAGRKTQPPPSYAPNVGASASSERPVVGAGLMKEQDARGAMSPETGPLSTAAGRETMSAGSATAGMSSAPTARDNGAGMLRDAPLLDDPLPPATPARANESPSSAARAQPIPDEFLEYEEDFHTHYDAQFGRAADARYDEYVPAYRYGATIGRDSRYQDRPWDDDVELEARHDWERAAPEGSWDRFKAAVRHGWERVTGHHSHH
jgi:hypothetical protein